MGKIQLDFKEFKELLKMGLIKHKTKRGKNGKKTKYISRKDAVKAIKKAYEMGGEKSGSSHMVGSAVPMNNVGNTLSMESQRLANEKMQNSINDDKQKQVLSRFNDPMSTQLTIRDSISSEPNRFDAIYQNNPTLKYNDFLHDRHYRNFDELNNKIDNLNANYFNPKGNSKFAQYEENENDKDNIIVYSTQKTTKPIIEEIDDDERQDEKPVNSMFIGDDNYPQLSKIYPNKLYTDRNDESLFVHDQPFWSPMKHNAGSIYKVQENPLNDELLNSDFLNVDLDDSSLYNDLQVEDSRIRTPPSKYNNLTSGSSLDARPNILSQSDEGSNRIKQLKAETDDTVSEIKRLAEKIKSKKAEPEPAQVQMMVEDVNSDDEEQQIADPKNDLTHKMMMNVIIGYNKKNPNSKIKYTKSVNGKTKQFNTDELHKALKDYGLL